tara:strand:+ start:103 stop:1368 length:1266 start_codon:yes stop_codon:yes gene_type:complete
MNQHLSISPSNHLANATVSYRNGNPVVKFEIGETNKILLPSSIRLVGKYAVYSDASRTTPVAGDFMQTPSNLGVYATIDQLSFRTQRSKSEIETINNYNRMMSSYLPVTTSLQDNVSHLNESSLVMPNVATNKATIIENTETVSSNSFCIPLISGFTSSNNPYPLYQQGVEVTVQLAPDSNVLFSDDLDVSHFTEGFYEFSDLRLICEVTDAGSSPAMMGTYEYNTITTFFSTINSTNAQISLNLGQSRVLGVFGSFIPSKFINNLTQNGLATLYPRKSDTEEAVIEQLVVMRGGERFPWIYNLDTVQKNLADDESPDSQIVRNYLNAVVEFSKLNRTSGAPYNTNLRGGDYKALIEGGAGGAGIGFAFDVISGQGVDFSSQPLGISMELDLTNDYPNALYLFIHSKQSLLMSNKDIQVVQ